MSIIREAACLSDLPPQALYRAVSQVGRWPEWDPELDSVTCDQDVATTGTRVVMRFETFGLLAFLWDRVLVRGQVAGAAAQVARMAAFARANA